MDKPIVLISKCIEHGSCRYDGNSISDGFVKTLKEYVNFKPVCPEVAIGLGIPRQAIRIIYKEGDLRLVSSKAGVDVTDEMKSFTSGYIESLSEIYDGAILKSKSPSCGIKNVKVYKDIGKVPSLSQKTIGFFGGEINKVFYDLPVEDEKRLISPLIKDHFLTQLFSVARFHQMRQDKSLKALVEFQSHNKYLLMSYHQLNQKKLGKIVANHEKYSVEEVYKKYETLLKRTLKTPLQRGKNINMLMHILGYFKDELTANEKAYFLDVLEDYNKKNVSIRIPLAILRSWVVRFEEPYLLKQTIFAPYPIELMETT